MASEVIVLPKLVAFISAICLILAGFAWQAWDLWGIRKGKFLDDAQLTISAPSQQAAGPGLDEIAGMHLFGNPADKPPPEPEKPAALPVTDLKLVLVGAITDSDPQKASALIQAESMTKRYYVGDDIRGQAVLHEVASDSVVLKRGNRFEKLQFPKGGEMNPEAKEALSKMTGKPVQQPAAAMVGSPNQQTGQEMPQTQAQPPSQPTAKPATSDTGRTGQSLRDRLQRRPKITQQPPGH